MQKAGYMAFTSSDSYLHCSHIGAIGHWLDFVLSHALVYKIQACCAQQNLLTSGFLFPCWAVMAELTDVASL